MPIKYNDIIRINTPGLTSGFCNIPENGNNLNSMKTIKIIKKSLKLCVKIILNNKNS